MGILQMASGKKWESGLEAELRKLQKRELRKMKQAKKERSNGLLLRVEEKIPHKVLSGLNVIIHLVNRGLKIGTAVVKDAQGKPFQLPMRMLLNT